MSPDYKYEGENKKEEQKTGLLFSQAEVEDILHEGTLKPNHDGAFEIKKDYMDMSSSDDELEQ